MEAGGAPELLLTPERLQELAEEYAEPKVTVNGEERRFASFAEMKDSSEFKMAQSVMRLMGAAKELKILTTYLDMKIAEEQEQARGTALNA